MLAGRLDFATGGFAMLAVPVPAPGPGEALVKVMAAGVCLSDAHLIQGLKPAQRTVDQVTLGHETAGVVAALGPGVSGWAPGDRVLVEAIITAGGRRLTMGVHYDGGWAEYAAVPAHTLHAIPPAMTFEEAAVIPDAVATPWGSIRDVARAAPAEAAGVWGVGGLGAHTVRLLRIIGAAPIIGVDPLPEARRRALDFGADFAFDPASETLDDDVRAATGGAGLAAAFDMAGFEGVVEQILPLLAPRGRVAVTGISGRPITITDSVGFIGPEKQILGHYGSTTRHLTEVIRLAELGRLDLAPSVSQTMPLAQAPAAVDRLLAKTGHPIRIVLRPQD
jgi:threonine dehydrogenase-like Zn-dependent dehydrogenase